MNYNRKRNRLKDFDYSNGGCYFLTICTKNRVNYFGEIINSEIKLNDFGKIAQEMWKGLPKVFEKIELDAYVVMPNHLHGIIAITEDLSALNADVNLKSNSDFDPDQVRDAYSKIENLVGNATTSLTVRRYKTDIVENNIKTKQAAKLHSLQNSLSRRTKMYLSKVIQAYKAEVTRRIKRISINKITGSVWQKSFYDRIIRNEKEFYNIQGYIFENPVRWEYDIENKFNLGIDINYYEKIFKK